MEGTLTAASGGVQGRECFPRQAKLLSLHCIVLILASILIS